MSNILPLPNNMLFQPKPQPIRTKPHPIHYTHNQLIYFLILTKPEKTQLAFILLTNLKR